MPVFFELVFDDVFVDVGFLAAVDLPLDTGFAATVVVAACFVERLDDAVRVGDGFPTTSD